MKKMILILTILFLLQINYAYSQISYGKTFDIFDDLSVTGRYDILNLNNDTLVICASNSNSIYVQFFTINGIKIEDKILVSGNSNKECFYPKLIKLDDSKFLACWEAKNYYSKNHYHYNIYGRIIDLNGNTIGEELTLNTITDGHQRHPCVSNVTDSTIIVCYDGNSETYWQYGLDNQGIYGQLYNQNMMKIGDEFIINTTQYNIQRLPYSCNVLNKYFFVCWNHITYNDTIFPYGTNYDCYGQILSPNGEKIGNEIIISNIQYPASYNFYTESFKDSSFIVAWANSNTQDKIYLQKYDYFGNENSEKYIIENEQTYGELYITTLSNNNFIIFWNSIKGGIFGQYFNRFLDPIGNIFRVSDIGRYAKSSFLDSLGFIVTHAYDRLIYELYPLTPHNFDLKFFNLNKPQDNSTHSTFNINFSWSDENQLSGNPTFGITYDLYIDDNYSFTNPLKYYGFQDNKFNSNLHYLDPGKQYYWKVVVNNIAGKNLTSNIYSFYIHETTNVENDNQNSISFFMTNNFPNPFNCQTQISYKLNISGKIQIDIYNDLGQKVRTLFEGYKSPGKHQVIWDGRDDNLHPITSGIYFISLESKSQRSIKKVLLLK